MPTVTKPSYPSTDEWKQWTKYQGKSSGIEWNLKSTAGKVRDVAADGSIDEGPGNKVEQNVVIRTRARGAEAAPSTEQTWLETGKNTGPRQLENGSLLTVQPSKLLASAIEYQSGEAARENQKMRESSPLVKKDKHPLPNDHQTDSLRKINNESLSQAFAAASLYQKPDIRPASSPFNRQTQESLPHNGVIHLKITPTRRLKEIFCMESFEVLAGVLGAFKNAKPATKSYIQYTPNFSRASIGKQGTLTITLRTKNAHDCSRLGMVQNWAEPFCTSKSTLLPWVIHVSDPTRQIILDPSPLTRAKVMRDLEIENQCAIHNLLWYDACGTSENMIPLQLKYRNQANDILSTGILVEGQRYAARIAGGPPFEICGRCMRYGHMNKVCTGPKVCSWCGAKDHDRISCQSKVPKCVGCLQNHVSDTERCPIRERIREQNHFPTRDELYHIIGQIRSRHLRLDIPGPPPLDQQTQNGHNDESRHTPKPSSTPNLPPSTPVRSKMKEISRPMISIQSVQDDIQRRIADSSPSKPAALSKENLKKLDEQSPKQAEKRETSEDLGALREQLTEDRQAWVRRWNAANANPERPKPRGESRNQNMPPAPKKAAKPSGPNKDPKKNLIDIDEEDGPKWNSVPAEQAHLRPWWEADWNVIEDDGAISFPIRDKKIGSTIVYHFGDKRKKPPEHELKDLL